MGSVVFLQYLAVESKRSDTEFCRSVLSVFVLLKRDFLIAQQIIGDQAKRPGEKYEQQPKAASFATLFRIPVNPDETRDIQDHHQAGKAKAADEEKIAE